MDGIETDKKVDIDAKLKEAETYLTMGLLSESLGTYEQLLPKLGELDPEHQEIVEKNIELLKKKISDPEEHAPEEFSTEGISFLKETKVTEENAPRIHDSAFALKELGLCSEAFAEYEKLFLLEYPLQHVIAEMTDCLLKIHTPSNAKEHIAQVLSKDGLSKKKKAGIQFHFGREMEKRDHNDVALELYQAALKQDPKNKDIQDRLDAMTAGVSTGSRYDYLLNKNMVTTEQLQKALAISKKVKKSIEFVLTEKFKVKKRDVVKSLSYFYDCPHRTFDPEIPTPIELIQNLKKAFLLQDQWVPITWSKEGVEILVDDPRNLNKTDHIRALIKSKKIIFSVGIKEDIEAFIRHFFDQSQKEEPGTPAASMDDFEMPEVSFEEELEEEDDIDEADEASGQVVRLVDQILVTAFRKNTSDIHIEPSPVTKATTVRFRMDGVCQEYLQVPNTMAKGILSRLKIMAGLDIAERRLPQDGKIKFKRKGIPPFELRLATLPTAGGYEDAVLRILAKAGAMDMLDMGLNDRNLMVLKSMIAKPYGLVLVVGPTGSGKTTSLHAALGNINKPGIKIWTAEDPVEITQAGLRQVEARPKIGLDFARIMRAFLRADPDVIMIGEMRDNETASIGIEASLTGHLVFSTLHTNSAPETVTRLLDMGLNPLNFSDAFLGVLAQRLVRKLCTNCREEYHPSEEEFQEIVSDFGTEYFEATGITYSEDLMLQRPVGCESCSDTGYRGRTGIHELMDGTKEIKRLIKKQANAEELKEQAMKEGMTTLKQDGIMKTFNGLTHISEVRRVCIE